MGRLGRLWYRITSTFWFLPAVIVTGATLLAFVTIEADARYITADALKAWPRMFGAGASASRSLLTAVAGSMITVAGTVFSITLVALSLASSQYSSRVLRNFIRDRTNQSVLGLFVGIFAYCLVVLRSIYGSDENAFVPSVAVFLGLLLGFGGIGVLVFFIHHIAQSIQASQILEAVRVETSGAIARVFPRHVREEAAHAELLDAQWRPAHHADTTGYLQFVDFSRLHDIARAQGATLRVEPRIGDYVLAGDCVVATSGEPSAALERDLAECWSIGPQRTLEQDVGFGIRQLVDVALKALSAGVNDTTTAIMCVDSLASVLAELAPRDLRFAGCDDDGVIRVEARHPRFESLLDEAFDQIRHSAGDNMAVLDRLRWALEVLERRTPTPSRRVALEQHARRLASTIDRELRDPLDRERLGVSLSRLLSSLERPRNL